MLIVLSYLHHPFQPVSVGKRGAGPWFGRAEMHGLALI
jgi:hypothetical protein